MEQDFKSRYPELAKSLAKSDTNLQLEYRGGLTGSRSYEQVKSEIRQSCFNVPHFESAGPSFLRDREYRQALCREVKLLSIFDL